MKLPSFLQSLFCCECDDNGSTVDVVAKVDTNGVPGAVNLLGPDGRNYALHYRVGAGEWKPVVFVEDFPV
jgi:hypothetical protein